VVSGHAVKEREPAGGTRPLRADARRNEAKLLDAARQVFAKYGSDASMEAIAKHAGVGVGTLYRHFPKRVDVVEGLYRNDVDLLVSAAEEAMAEADAWEGLAGWLEAYVRYAQSKKTLLSELQDAFSKNPQLKLDSRERIIAALSRVLGRAQQAGRAREDVGAEDLMNLLWAMCPNASEPQSRRMLAVVLDGLRRQPAEAGEGAASA
jgi:AcrR family transcriptional regulator